MSILSNHRLPHKTEGDGTQKGLRHILVTKYIVITIVFNVALWLRRRKLLSLVTWIGK